LAIDRAEDGDALRHSGGPAVVDGPAAVVLADPERRAAIHRLHHAIVDHTYGVARDAWARALPGLRAVWADHVARYPDRARAAARTQPDGAWVADETRKLNPEQNAEVDRGVARIREVGRQVIVPGMRAVEAEDVSRHLAGLENRFKGEDRLKEKVADQLRSAPALTPTEALSAIPDAVRFTLRYAETAYTAGVRKDVERIEVSGFILIECRNTWAFDQYKGINSRWREPESGVVFEVQFHTQASLEAKELTHKAYERIRSPAQNPELTELKEFQRHVSSMIPIPPDVADIEDYPPGEA
jgi:hypothetical protein